VNCGDVLIDHRHDENEDEALEGTLLLLLLLRNPPPC